MSDQELIDRVAKAIEDKMSDPTDLYDSVALAAGALAAIRAAGFVLCKMPGGVNKGTCPTCGCEPYDERPSA